jgi:hypothetical protein
MKKKIVKLENVFTGDVVLFDESSEVREIDGIPFIQVCKEEKKDRFFFVKRSAYKVLNK